MDVEKTLCTSNLVWFVQKVVLTSIQGYLNVMGIRWTVKRCSFEFDSCCCVVHPTFVTFKRRWKNSIKYFIFLHFFTFHTQTVDATLMISICVGVLVFIILVCGSFYLWRRFGRSSSHYQVCHVTSLISIFG